MSIETEGGYCPKCGFHHNEETCFCPKCGTNLKNSTSPQSPHEDPGFDKKAKRFIHSLADKERTSGTIWLLIGLYQIIFGIATMIIMAAETSEAYMLVGLAPLWIGILNLIEGIGNKKRANKVLTPYPGMIEEYEGMLSGILFALIWNFLLGGIIGIIGNIYDLSKRNYALSNQDIVEEVFESARKKARADAQGSGKLKLEIQYTRTGSAAKVLLYKLDDDPTQHRITVTTPGEHYVTAGTHRIILGAKPISVIVDTDTTVTIRGTAWGYKRI